MATRALDKKYLKMTFQPGRVAQFVTRLTPDPGATSPIPERSHTFVEIDHEIILLLSLIQKGLLSVTSESARSTA